MKEELENELKEIDKGFQLLQTRRLEVKEKLFRLKWGFGKGSTIMLDGATMIVDQVGMWATCRKITKKGVPSLAATTLYSSDLPKVKNHYSMKEYKKLDLKNGEDADRFVDHLNQGWELFREFTGWVVVCKDKEDVVSPADEPEKPIFRPHKEWFEMLKEPLRSQALEAMEKFPRLLNSSASILESFYSAFSWDETGMFKKWHGVAHFFEGQTIDTFENAEFCGGYNLAKLCAPDGWEKSQSAGE